MKKLVIFPFGFKNKTGYIINRFLPSDRNDFSSVLYLTSRQTKIEDFKICLWKIKQNPVIPPQSFTFKSFAAKTVEENSPYKTINRIEEFFIVYQMLENYKNHTINPVSFTEKLTSFIKDIKISHPMADKEFYKNETSKFQWKYPKNKEMIIFALDILKKYQDYLSKNLLADEDDLYQIASENINLTEYNMLIIDGLYEILPNQKRFFQTIINQIYESVFVHYYDNDLSLDAKEMILKKNLETIKSFTEWDIDVLPEDKKETKVLMLSCPSPEEEIKNIAEKVHQILLQGSASEDVLVVFPSMPSYRPLVQRIFKRMGIPFRLTPGYFLIQDDSIVSIFSLFDYIESPDWKNMMGVFFSPFFSFDKNEAEKFSEESRKSFEGIGFFPDKKYLKKWRNYRLLQSAVKGIDKNSMAIEDWSKELKRSLEKIKWKPFDNEVGEDFFKILGSMEKNVIVQRKEFVSIFSSILNMFEVEKSKGAGIRVMGVLDSSGIEIKYVFFGGVSSDNLPMCQKADEFFIPDTLKEVLGLNHFSLMIARERLDLHRLKKESEQIVFTYPVRANGEKKTRSIMLYDYPAEITVLKNVYFSGEKNIFNVSFDKKKFKDKFFKYGIFQFSVTDMDKIARCPYRFYLENVEGITLYKEPVIEEVPRVWGNIVHKTLEEITKPYSGKTIDDKVIKEWHERFEERCRVYIEQPEMADERLWRISPIVRNFLKLRLSSITETFVNIVKLHKGHMIHAVEEKVLMTKENILFKGKFDRVEEAPDFFEIIDIKTGGINEIHLKNLQKESDSTSIFKIGNLQIPIYYCMALEKFKKPVKIYEWALNFDEKKAMEKPYEFDENFNPLFEKHLSRFSESLYDNTFSFYPPEDQKCYACLFREFCFLSNKQ